VFGHVRPVLPGSPSFVAPCRAGRADPGLHDFELAVLGSRSNVPCPPAAAYDSHRSKAVLPVSRTGWTNLIAADLLTRKRPTGRAARPTT
jgi:hypothetical protein